jgi:hypothetical protein
MKAIHESDRRAGDGQDHRQSLPQDDVGAAAAFFENTGRAMDGASLVLKSDTSRTADADPALRRRRRTDARPERDLTNSWANDSLPTM